MAYSLQNLVVGETYNQLVHTGSSNLTGNNLYTADGTCIPYYITNSCFNYCADGQILRDLTIPSTLSGTAFQNNNTITNSTEVCVYGKNNTVVNTTCAYIIGGQSCFNGISICAANTYFSKISNTKLPTVGCGFTTVIGSHSANTWINCELALIGGTNHSLSGCSLGVIGGANHILSAGQTIKAVGGRNIKSQNGLGCGVFINPDQLSAYTGIVSHLFVTGGRNIAARSEAAGNFFVVTGDNIDVSCPGVCCGSIHTGKDIYIYHQLGRLCPTIITGLNNSQRKYCSSCATFMLNGSSNRVEELSAITSAGNESNIIYGGSNNTLSSITYGNYIVNGNYNILDKTIDKCRFDTVIINGMYNILSGSSTDSDILQNGYSNIILKCGEGCTGFIGTGRHNKTKSTLFTGVSNTSIQIETLIFTGIQNTINCIINGGQIMSGILFTGQNNYMNANANTMMFTGINNCIRPECNYNTIVTGTNNIILSGGCGKIISGINNNVFDSGVILGGRFNCANGSNISIIGSMLSGSGAVQRSIVNNLIITSLPVGSAGLPANTWFRNEGSDIVRIACPS